MSAETDDAPKQRGFGFWLSRFVLLIGLGVLFYYGYCWGWWGQSSLLLQYLFQCSCPPASEQARYPDNLDVIVSACKYGSSILSPSGRLLYVREEESGINSTYLLDLQTDEKIPFALPEGSNHFLTDDLIFHSYYGDDEYVLDRSTGQQYPIRQFVHLRRDAYINGNLNLNVLANELRDAGDVFLIDNNTIVALALGFQTSREHNFYIDQTSLQEYDPNRGEQFLTENRIDYQAVPGTFQEEALSPDRRFIAGKDGIYLAESGDKVVEAYTARGITGKYFSIQGWAYDSSGVIYYKFLDACLVELPSYDGGVCSIRVQQPLIKLKVPEEYLLPRETP